MSIRLLKIFSKFTNVKYIQEPITAGLEQYNCAILICELKISDDLILKQEVVKMKQIIDAFYDCVSEAIEKNKGDVQNLFQGKFHCIFGAPERLTYPHESAIKASELIQNKWQGCAHSEHSIFKMAVESGVLNCGMFGVSGRKKYEGIGNLYTLTETKLQSINWIKTKKY